jgi:hypothetical protein
MNFTQTADPARELYKIYQQFCAFGKGHRVAAQQLSMDSRTFQKFNKDAGLISKRMTRTSVDLIFTKVKARGQRSVDFNGFLECLRHVAAERQVTFDALVTYILRSNVGPGLNSATQAESVRFHDDTSSYTGVHKAGGPTTLGNGGDGQVITLSNLTDRSDYDVRGRKINKGAPTRGRGAAQQQRRLSAKGHLMLNSAMGAFPANTQQPMPSYAQPQQQHQQQQQQQRQAAPQRAAPAQPYRSAAPQAPQQRPQTSPSRKGGNIFDRLTDSSQYTGAHKHRFDSSGRGRGLEGRDRTAVGRGYVGSGVQHGGPRSTQKQYKGSTNTGSNQVFHDSSQFLMRR